MEPWLVSEVRISGDIKLISVVASGLPTSEDLEHIVDLETLRSVPVPPRQPVDLFIGVFSTANNFKRRMAVRRTWMQYLAVRSGAVAVRFFVGLVGFVCMFLISPNFFSSLSSVFLAWKNVPLGLYVIPATVNHTEVFATFLSQVSPEY